MDYSEVVLDEGRWPHDFDFLLICLHDLHFFRARWLTLALNGFATGLCLLLLLIVLLHTLQEGLVAPRLSQMLSAHVEALPQLPVAYNFGHLYADRIPVHVVDNTSPAMVIGVWHAFLDRRVHHDVD